MKRIVTPEALWAKHTADKHFIASLPLTECYASEHFAWKELFVHRTANDLKYLELKHLQNLAKLAMRLEGTRAEVLGNRPIEITSGWRDPISNHESGGATRSRHLTGEAADIRVRGLEPKPVQRLLEKTWKGGLGYGHTFTHLDIRPYTTRFTY
jgi:uncharacterized protein YcbK (DUF882 family)